MDLIRFKDNYYSFIYLLNNNISEKYLHEIRRNIPGTIIIVETAEQNNYFESYSNPENVQNYGMPKTVDSGTEINNKKSYSDFFLLNSEYQKKFLPDSLLKEQIMVINDCYSPSEYPTYKTTQNEVIFYIISENLRNTEKLSEISENLYKNIILKDKKIKINLVYDKQKDVEILFKEINLIYDRHSFKNVLINSKSFIFLNFDGFFSYDYLLLAVSYGIPLITTTKVAHILNFQDDINCLICDNLNSAIEKMFYLFDDEITRKRISENARNHIIECYSESAIDKNIKKILQLKKLEENFVLSNKDIYVSIIIITFNNLQYTRKAIQSIKKYTKIRHEIIVVDNNSSDYSDIYLDYAGELKLIKNSENKGFSYACNQALSISEGKYVLFINNDVLVTESWLENLIKYYQYDNSIGMVGPRSNYVSGYQYVNDFPNEEILINEDLGIKNEKLIEDYSFFNKKNNFGKMIYVERLTGLCLLIKREVIEKIGGFDEIFGIGNYEDDDFSLRAYLAGYKSVIALDVFIYHFGSKSFSQLGNEKYTEILNKNSQLFKDKWGVDHINYKEIFEIFKDSAQLKIPIKFSPSISRIRKTLSLCIIAKNESKNLRKCFDSLYDIIDEIIYVDTGSSDDSIEIAESYNAKIYKIEWKNDFSYARNIALSKCSSDWIIILDADESFRPDSVIELLKIINQNECDAITVNILNELKTDSLQKYDLIKLTRIFKNNKNYFYSGIVHEQIKPSILAANGKIIDSNISINHSGYLELSKEKINRNIDLLKRELKTGINKSYLNYNLGISYFSLKEYEISLNYLEESYQNYIINKSGLTEELLIKLLIKISQIYLETGRYVESKEWINEVLRINSDNIIGNYLLAANDFMLQNYQSSIDKLQKICLSENEKTKFDFSILYFDIGNSYYCLNNFNAAIKAYNSALEINSNSYMIYYNLARSFIKQNDIEKAKHNLKKAIGINEYFGEALILLKTLET